MFVSVGLCLTFLVSQRSGHQGLSHQERPGRGAERYSQRGAVYGVDLFLLPTRRHHD